MKAYLIEDEIIAREHLAKVLKDEFPDMEIVGESDSVAGSVEWLRNPDNHADVIFMDVELSDGKCFEIFRQVDIDAHIVMTTAYDNYAVKSFEVNSIDYLLKPIRREDLRRAVERCRRQDERQGSVDVSQLMAALGGVPKGENKWRERILVSINDRIVPVRTADIAFFFSEDKVNYVVTMEGSPWIVDASLDAMVSVLDPSLFFKISRSCIVAKDAISSVTKLLGGRLRVSTKIPADRQKALGQDVPDLIVSRSRSDDFLAWLQT